MSAAHFGAPPGNETAPPGDDGAGSGGFDERGGSAPSVADVSVAKWRWRIVGSDLSAKARHVALTLSVHLDTNGTCPQQYAPGLTKLCDESGRNRHTVIAALRELRGAGYLREVRRGVAKEHASVFQATAPVPEQSPVDEVAPVPVETPVLVTKEPLVTGEAPVPIQTPTGAYPDANRCLDEHPTTTHHPTIREGGGGGGALTAPADAGPLAPSRKAVAVLDAIRTGLPAKAEIVGAQLLDAIEAELTRGTDPDRIIRAATIDTANVKPRSWTGLVGSRLKAIERWADPIDTTTPEPKPPTGTPNLPTSEWRADRIRQVTDIYNAVGGIAGEMEEIWGEVIPGGGDIADMENRCEDELGCALWHDDGPRLRTQAAEGQLLYPNLRVLNELDDDELTAAVGIAKNVHAIAQHQRTLALRGDARTAKATCEHCGEEVLAVMIGAHLAMRHPEHDTAELDTAKLDDEEEPW